MEERVERTETMQVYVLAALNQTAINGGFVMTSVPRAFLPGAPEYVSVCHSVVNASAEKGRPQCIKSRRSRV